MKGNITIIGTGHILKRSVVDVKNKIEEIKPEIVTVELDEGRFRALMERYNHKGDKNRKGDWGGGSFPPFNWRSLPDFSPRDIIGYILSKIQDDLGEQFGMMPGSDMLQAVESARSVDSEVILIDRRIDITLNHLLAIPFKEKIGILKIRKIDSHFINNFKVDGSPDRDGKKEGLSELLDEDVILNLMNEVKMNLPYIYGAIVDERDRIMAHNLFQIQTNNPNKKIVAVVGAGHKKGIERYLKDIDLGRMDLKLDKRLLQKKKTNVFDTFFLFFIVSIAFILLKIKFLIPHRK